MFVINKYLLNESILALPISLVVMGNRFEITIDYRFTIGKTKSTSYRLYNRFIATFSHNGEIQPTLLDKLIKFQKRAARLTLNKAMETPSAELFQQLGLDEI